MHNPAHFQENDREKLFQLIEEHPLGILVTGGGGGLDANHLPFELHRSQNALRCHVARSNPVWQQVADGDEVLVVFRAEQAYISPSWYPSKHEEHRQVPTWNYRVVHAHGRIAVRDDARFVHAHVARLSHTHEAGQPVPWKMKDAPQDFLRQLVGSLVGLEIDITRLEGKFKLNQNREPRDLRGAAEALQARGHTALSQAMVGTLRDS